MAVNFGYYRSSTGVVSNSVCQTTIGTVTEFTSFDNTTFIYDAPNFNGYRMKLGGGGASTSFIGELADISFYSPGAIHYPSIKISLDQNLNLFSYM